MQYNTRGAKCYRGSEPAERWCTPCSVQGTGRAPGAHWRARRRRRTDAVGVSHMIVGPPAAVAPGPSRAAAGRRVYTRVYTQVPYRYGTVPRYRRVHISNRRGEGPTPTSASSAGTRARLAGHTAGEILKAASEERVQGRAGTEGERQLTARGGRGGRRTGHGDLL